MLVVCDVVVLLFAWCHSCANRLPLLSGRSSLVARGACDSLADAQGEDRGGELAGAVWGVNQEEGRGWLGGPVC